MKNILAENMLRFGVKNLSDKSKRKLTRKSKLNEAPDAVAGAQPVEGEADASAPTMMNITNTPLLATAKSKVTIINDDSPGIVAITFPESAKALTAGQPAVRPGDGLIIQLPGSDYWLTVASFDKTALDKSGLATSLQNKPRTEFRVYYFKEGDKNSDYGNNVIWTGGWPTTTPADILLKSILVACKIADSSKIWQAKYWTPAVLKMYANGTRFGLKPLDLKPYNMQSYERESDISEAWTKKVVDAKALTSLPKV